MQRICFFAVLFAVAVLPHVAGAEQGGRAAEEVDLELVLAVDASGSVSTSLLDTQRNAFAAASRKPSLQNAILSGPLQKVAVLYFEFSGQNEQTLIVPWTTLSGAQDMDHFANALQSATGSGLAGETSISGAMMFARNVLAANGYASYRKVVDIAGNERNSDGPPVQDALQYLRQTGAVVNALVLPEPRLSDIGPYATLFFRVRGAAE